MKSISLTYIMILLFFLSCKRDRSQVSIYIQNLQDENHKIKVTINEEVLANLLLEKDQIAENYSEIKYLNEFGSIRMITISAGNNSLNTVVQDKNDFSQVFVTVKDSRKKRDYNNPEIFNHLKQGKYQNFNELVDSLYDYKIIAEKYIGKPITVEFK